MSSVAVPPTAGRPVDPVALSRVVRRLDAASEPPWLHREAARRMAERLAWIRRTPTRVVDWCARRGAGAEALAAACPRAQIVTVEPTRAAASAPTRPSGWRKWFGRERHAAVPPETIAPYSADLLWSNMGLHLVADPQAQFAQWRGWVAPEGFLMFTTLGPGTLPELRSLYADQGWGPALAPLVDMHDLGDMLVHSGFAEPVMDQEVLTLTWADAAAALSELRTLGGNVDPGRFAALRGRQWHQRLLAALDARRDPDGRVRLSFELVYGHAFAGAPRAALKDETRIGLQEMRAMVRAGKPPGPDGG